MEKEINGTQGSSRTLSISANISEFQDPFSLKATYGFRKETGSRTYFDKNNELIMIYCMSNIICLYNVVKKSCKYVTGHAYRIIRLVLSIDGRILVSSDKRNLHIWDLKNPNENDAVILKVIKEPFGGKRIDIAHVAISACSRYLIVVSTLHKITIHPEETYKGVYKVQFWEWSYDRETYEDMIQINDTYGKVKHVTFDCNEGHEKFFVLTFEEKAIFCFINEDNKISMHKPSICQLKSSLICTTYVKDSTIVVSAASDGKVLLWDDTHNVTPKIKGTNLKTLYKVVNLKDSTMIDMTIIDNYIVIIDKDGDIRFYDQNLKLMYISSTQELTLGTSTLISILPSIQKREFQLDCESIYIKDDCDGESIISVKTCVQNYTITRDPFIVRKFFLVNEAGDLAMIDIVKKEFKIILSSAEDFYVAMDIYQQKTWTFGATKGGWLLICNYETNNTIAKYHFHPKDKPLKEENKKLLKCSVTCIKVSHNENFVALGYDNGNLWMMDPITAKETYEWPLKYTEYAIRKIVFKETDNNICALADEKNALVLIHFNDIKWEMIAKFQYHCMPIIGIFFMSYQEENYLITIGHDRMYVRYKVSHQTKKLEPDNDVRLEQAPKLTAAEMLPSKILANNTSRSGNVIIVANNHFKIVFYDAYTSENLFTFLGPIFESPIQKFLFCPPRFNSNETPILLFTTFKSMGTAILPLDGNPFRYSGILAHHTKISTFQLNYDSTGVIINGEGDVGPTYWDLKRENMYKKLEVGGKGLEPYLKLLPGGKYGHFFNEMIQFFYYIQLMEDSTDASERRTITEFIKVSEIVDFMRAIGFFPSEYEAKNLINETMRTKESWEAPPTHICFTDLIKLYFNHRLVEGYRFSKILDALKFLLSGRLRFAIGDSIDMNVVHLSRLLDVITLKGERISEIQALRYLLELLDVEDRGIKRKISELSDEQVLRNFKKLPNELNIHEFCYKVFGMETLDAEKMINIFEKSEVFDRFSGNVNEIDKANTKDDCLLSHSDSDENDNLE